MSASNNSNLRNNKERLSETRENITLEPQPSTSSEVGENEIRTTSAKPKRSQSIDSITSNESNPRGGRIIDHDGEQPNEEARKDDHVFLKPGTSSLEVGAPKTPTHKWKINKKSNSYKFSENSISPKKLRSRDKKFTKSSSTDNDSPWRRADQGAGEDISWTSSAPRKKHISSTSSDEGLSSVKSNQPRKKQTKGSSTKSGTSCSSDSSSKQSQRFYLKEEEIKILDFIIQHKAFSEVKGNRLWKIMEATQVVHERSSQSMKERFRRHIFPKLTKYEHLSKADIDNFKNPPKEEIENTGSKAISHNSTSPAAEQNTSNPDGSESTTEETSKEDDNATVASDSNRSTTSVVSGIKQSRNYTMAEEIGILKFIITNRRFSEVNGNSLWQLMETKKVVDNRSWQSMKERFRRHIGPNLDRYEGLTSKEINQFNKYLSAVSKNIKKKSK